MRPTLRLAAAVSVVFLSLTGCSRPEFELGEVTGVVTYDDQPLARANVVFQPKGGIGTTSIGFTNDKGEYRLTFSRTAKGAIVGGHEVVINVWPTDENPKPIKVPARYNTATELSAEVKPGDEHVRLRAHVRQNGPEERLRRTTIEEGSVLRVRNQKPARGLLVYIKPSFTGDKSTDSRPLSGRQEAVPP